MLDGVHLTLLIGPLMAPMPAPLPLVEALQSVQVTAGRDRTGFQLTFTLGKLSPLQTMLAVGSLDPMVTRVVIIVTMSGMPTCDLRRRGDAARRRAEQRARAVDAHTDRRRFERTDGCDANQNIL